MNKWNHSNNMICLSKFHFTLYDTGYDKFEENKILKKEEYENININREDVCSEGGKHEIINDENEAKIICKKCGETIVENIINTTPEWNNYDDINECGCSMVNNLLPQSSLSVPILSRSLKLRTLQNWDAMPYNERSLNKEYKFIDEICNKHNVPKCIINDSKIIFKNISECQVKGRNVIFRGNNRIDIIVACVYFAYSKSENSKSPTELSAMFNINKKELTKGIKKFLKIANIGNLNLNITYSLPEHYIENYCKQLKLNKTITNAIFNIAKNITRLGIHMSHTPISIACGSILLCIDNIEKGKTNINKKTLSEKFHISKATINKAYSKMLEYKNELLQNNSEIVKIENTVSINDIKNKLHLFELYVNNGDFDIKMLDNIDLCLNNAIN